MPSGGTTDCACVNAACNGEAVGRLWVVRFRCSTEPEGCFAARFVWILLLRGRVVALGRGRVRVIPGLQLKLPMIGLVIGPIIGADGSELGQPPEKDRPREPVVRGSEVGHVGIVTSGSSGGMRGNLVISKGVFV